MSGALHEIVRASEDLLPVIVVGAPVQAEGGLFNAAIVIHRGRILGAVPKSYIPEYHEYYEKRQFRAARDLVSDEVRLLGETVPFTPDLVFACRDVPGVRARRRDLRGPVDADPARARTRRSPAPPCWPTSRPPTSPIGKDGYRRMLCEAQSGRAIAGYLYTAAGLGESTTDMAWDGQALIYENGQLLRESERFADRAGAHRRRPRSRPDPV